MLVLIISVLITLDLIGAKPAVKYYSSKYEHIDVGAILNNRRMVNYYTACLLSQGPCPPEGVELKRILPEALQTNCQRCSEKQAAIALRVIKRLRKEYPKIWSQLIAKWDPDDVYVKKFESSFGSKTATSKPCQDPNNNKQHTPILQDRNSTTITQLKPISITNKIITSTNLSLHNISNKTISIDQTIGTTQNPSIISSTITTTTGKTIITTKLPTIPGLIPLNTFFTNPPIPIRPIGVNIRATVSGLVRSLGAIGSRVMETGAEIAEVVIKNIVKPLPV